jgi:hypothetical protein
LETQTFASTKEISNSIAWESEADIVFYSKGIILQQWPPWKQTVNDIYYANTLKSHLMEGNRKKAGVPHEIVVSAPRGWAAVYCICDDGGASRHLWNTCRTPTQQSRLRFI